MCPTCVAFRISAFFVAIIVAASLGTKWQPALASDDCHASPAPNVNWQACDKSLIMLEGSDLADANLSEADLTSADLRSTDLTAANLEKATLVRASLADSKAGKARLGRIEAYRTDFSRIAANGATFQSAELQRSKFHKAQLANTDFTKADLGRSEFDGAELGGSRFALASLARAEFHGATFNAPADFDRAFLFLARIEGVDLSSATGLTQWQLDMACGDDKTILPKGLKKPAAWPCSFKQD